MINLMINFFKIKFTFRQPQKKKILLYDGVTENYIKEIFKNYSIFYNRWEEINLYVFIFTFFKDGIFKFRKNYKINYFKFVSPKIIISFIDNFSFLKLSYLFKKPKYISVQTLLRNNSYYKNLKIEYEKNKKKRFKLDYCFVFNKTEVKKMRKYVKTNFLYTGNYANNLYPNKPNLKYLKKKKLFILLVFD